jgi:indolepyruvate ferredoxin oxidoreductase
LEDKIYPRNREFGGKNCSLTGATRRKRQTIPQEEKQNLSLGRESILSAPLGGVMSKRVVSLDDKYGALDGRVFATGIQALVRLPLDQKRLDRRRGLNTAGFISGYRGSPLGGYDQQLKRAQKFLDSHDIVLWEGLNEDLGATAVWGSQQVGLFPGARFDGVFGLWYGKAPGVDRTGDVFKHGNFAGVSRHGGVLAIAGDDHNCKSSTLPSQSEFAFQDAEMPVLSPASVQDVLDMGLIGLAMSRYSGAWVGMIALADTMDSGAVIDVGLDRLEIVDPSAALDVHMRPADKPMDKEARLRLLKLPAAQAFARANRLDKVVLGSPRPRLGVISTGQATRDIFEALECIGMGPKRAAEAGLSVFKVGMPWPLEPQAVRAFCDGLEEVIVVEHKRDLIESQLKAALYDLPEGRRPRIVGKRDEVGAPLLSPVGALPIPVIAKAIHDRLAPEHRPEAAVAYFARVARTLDAAKALEGDVLRKAHFCSGCPHNTSTVVPEGSRALAGIGCHYMATFMGRADMTSQMGGEGIAWVGQTPFTDEKHVFVNLGDGTYSHSGSLAIRAAVSAGINVTYKILYNGAVAMTGGQDVESGQTVAQLVHQLRGEGVAEVVVVADDPERHVQSGEIGPLVKIYGRDRLAEVQTRLRDVKGVTIIIYDQVCATERRRKVKRGLARPATKRAFINTEVCEGCGDCSVQSNCLSIEPVETEIGTKRRINQSSCNQDVRCVDGFCPSFVTVEGATNAARIRTRPAIDAANLPEPELPALVHPWSMIFTGVGGTGVTTIAAILGMAAHIDGLAATTLDMTGLAQKGGPVVSHVRIAREPEEIRSGRTPTASASALVAGDLIVATSAEALSLVDPATTRAVANSDVAPTADFIQDRTARFDGGRMRRKLEKAAASLALVDAESLSETYFFDAVFANMIMLGFAWGRGLVPVSRDAISGAIELNGAAVKDNLAAFDLGRIAALAPDRIAAKPLRPGPAELTLDDLIADRARRLTDYQDAGYAARYLAFIDHVRTRETAAGLGEKLSRAVARNAYKLMAYKDEFEVARLYTNGVWEAALKEMFAGDYKLSFHLAPPLLAPRDAVTGRPRKMRFGRWMFTGFKLLAAARRLRGTWADPFGRTQERAMERRLRDEYEAQMRALADSLDASAHDLAVRLAKLPDAIRGYGHVKHAAVEDAERERARLLAAIETARLAGSQSAPGAAQRVPEAAVE